VLSTGKNDAAELIPLLVADVYHLAGAFRRLGSGIARRVGQTQAQWQVLSVISGGPRTVAQIARRLGYARQSVQRTADQLIRGRLARYMPNPDHKKSPLVEITDQGTNTLARITREAEKWHCELALDLKPGELATALRVVRHLCSAVESGSRKQVSDT
jgi:DNA-binding MarR family transcriptional regulator